MCPKRPYMHFLKQHIEFQSIDFILGHKESIKVLKIKIIYIMFCNHNTFKLEINSKKLNKVHIFPESIITSINKPPSKKRAFKKQTIWDVYVA